MKPIKEGKVREIYDNGDSLIMVATDRISCFDVILNNVVTKKGTVLTQMSKFWFNLTKDIIPNHMISTDVKDMPEFFQKPEFDGNSMMCRKLEMLPIECIVRGYITGSGWASYKENGTVCGITLPEGLKESNFQNQSTHHLQKLRLVTTTRIFPMSRALLILKNTSLEKAKSMPRSFAITPSLFIRNVRTTH
jgi:phosphoribosylaminoimidazole-succinocarboxamide synthase